MAEMGFMPVKIQFKTKLVRFFLAGCGLISVPPFRISLCLCLIPMPAKLTAEDRRRALQISKIRMHRLRK